MHQQQLLTPSSVCDPSITGLSFAGKEVPLKSVIQALPAYSMSCFKLTKGLCKKLTTLMSKYWWAGSLDRHGLHWQAWNKLAIPKGQGGIGFRNLELFNDAMLRKQAWRLMEQPDSLCAKVLKGRYYPDTEFLLAGCPKRASPHTIIQGRDALKLGLTKRIGNGQSTKVWEDRWLPDMQGMKPLGCMAETNIQFVSELVDDNGEWKEDAIREIFFPIDAEAILRLPRPRTNLEDVWAWVGEKSGIYSVRSCYRSLLQGEDTVANTANTSDGNVQTWKPLWKLRVMPKIRIFWWRVIKNLLPCYDTLQKRHVREISHCPLCGCREETLFHSLMECDHALLFWNEALVFFDLKQPRLHPATWACDILDPGVTSKEQAAIAVSLMWSIWSSRNKFTHGELAYQPLGSMHLIKELVSALEIPNQVGEVKKLCRDKWKRSAEGWIKISSDAAIDLIGRRAGTCIIVARSDHGEFLGARCGRLNCITDPLIVEMLGCRDVIDWAFQKEYNRVEVETDCQNLVALWHCDVQRSADCHIVQEMKRLRSSFQEFRMQFVRREVNQAAHLCAKHSLSIDSSFLLLFDVIPGFLTAPEYLSSEL